MREMVDLVENSGGFVLGADRCDSDDGKQMMKMKMIMMDDLDSDLDLLSLVVNNVPIVLHYVATVVLKAAARDL